MTNTAPASGTGSREVGPPVPFDPELAVALDVASRREQPALNAENLPALRAARIESGPSDDDLTVDGAYLLSDETAPGPDGAPDVPVLVCRPSGEGPLLGAVYYMHGGGMVLGSNRGNDVLAFLTVAAGLRVAVFAVDYRLAPENPHPAPVDDCYTGLLWTVERAGELGVTKDRIVIAGTSAGGGLAAATALLARDRGAPALAGQMLLCPMLDDRNDTPSARQMAGLGVWDHAANEFGWTALLGERRGGDDVSPYAAPARADDLSGLPPAFVDVGSAETFRDEDVAYATRLWQAGVQAELHVWPGGFHGFSLLAPEAVIARASMVPRAPWLRRVLGG
jgi:acetyl esterase/lipase